VKIDEGWLHGRLRVTVSHADRNALMQTEEIAEI
jgi:hypothetical protein